MQVQHWCKVVSSAGAATSTIFVVTNILSRQTHVFCNKSMLVATKLLSQQTYFCWDKYLSWQTILSQQKFCHDKLTFVATKVCLSQQQNTCLLWQNIFVATKLKHKFVTTKVLSLQAYIFHGKGHVLNSCLSWQIFCCDKNDTCGSSCQW